MKRLKWHLGCKPGWDYCNIIGISSLSCWERPSLLLRVKGEAQKAESGGAVLGEGIARHFRTIPRAYSRAVSSRNRVWGRAPAAKKFYCILEGPDGLSRNLLGPSLGRGTWTLGPSTCKTNPFHIGPVSLVQFSNLFQQLGRLLRSKVDVCKVLRCADAVLARVVVTKQRLDGVRSEQGVRHERTRQPANHESTLRLHNQGHYVQNILQLYMPSVLWRCWLLAGRVSGL